MQGQFRICRIVLYQENLNRTRLSQDDPPRFARAWVLRLGLKSKEESGCPIGLRLSPSLTAMFMNNALDCSRPHACPLEVFLTMELLEYSEELIGITGVEAHSIVRYKECCGVVGFARTYLNYSGLPRSREFGSIGKKIREN